MNRYYCPYCYPCYEFQKQRDDGVPICGQCGDPLVKIPLVRPIQVFAFIAASAFIIPFVLMMASLFKELNRQQPGRDLESMPILSTYIRQEMK